MSDYLRGSVVLHRDLITVTNHLIRRFKLDDVWQYEMARVYKMEEDGSYGHRVLEFSHKVLSIVQNLYIKELSGKRVGELLEISKGCNVVIPVHHLHWFYLKPAMNGFNDLTDLHYVQQLLLAMFLAAVIECRFDHESGVTPKYLSARKKE
ncbi:MAG: hypothetical protein WCF94_04215 [bacterium]